jgi:hypothetical protein
MAGITITASDTCAGGGHVTFTITGAKSAVIKGVVVADLIGPIDDAEVEAFVKLCVRLAKVDRTVNQLKTDLQNGLVVSI